MKKFFIVFNLMLFVLLFVGCNEKNNEDDGMKYDNPYFVYEMAQKEGFTGTYEEWLNLIKGIDGKSIVDVEISEEGELVITMSDDETINLGNIKGEPGNGIRKIELLKSVGLKDTYIIYYTDGTTSTFTITNGGDGEDGDKGEQGNKGDEGKPGKSAYEIYLEQNPDYTKTEEEWMEDLINGHLGKKHTVTFDSKGGSAVDSQIVNHNEKVIKPDDPTRSGYTFLGWYCGEEKWSFIGYSVTENITLKAKWESIYGMHINPLNSIYYVGEQITLSCIITDTELQGSAIRWTSSNSEVATIENNGKVTFIAPGKVTFTATIAANANIKVTSDEIMVEKPALERLFIEGSTKIEVGGSTILRTTSTPYYADRSAVWIVDNPLVAEINSETGEIKGLKAGSVIVTAVSKVNPEIYATFNVKVIGEESQYNPISVTIIGPQVCLVGYEIKLAATVYPLTANQNVIWTSSNEAALKIDENGYCLGLSAGKVRIRAYSAVDEEIFSEYFTVEVKEDETDATAVDMQGYKIVIMNASSDLHSIDPNLDGYVAIDKAAKKAAWKAVEDKYNCDLSVEAYPDTATWGTARIDYINDSVSAGTATADLYTVSSAWIAGFVEADSALDVTEYYETYGKYQMENAQREAGTVQGKIYIASTGTNKANSSVDLGLFYNYDKVVELGVKDPAEMFNDGEWTYTNFDAWAKEVQAKLNAEEGEYALGGHSLYYWTGMTAAAGVKITDASLAEINVDSVQSKQAMELMNGLVNAGAVNPSPDWAEGQGDNGFQNQKNVMTTGSLWFTTATNRWKDMWGEGKTNIAYVPFPYPDSIAKEDTRITVNGLTVYMYAKGRDSAYTPGINAEHVYKAVNEMFLSTILKQNQDPTFDAETELRNSLAGKIANEESIKAAMFYTSARVMFDPTLSVYSTIASSPFRSATISIMYDGADYQNTVDAIKEQFYNDVLKKYS